MRFDIMNDPAFRNALFPNFTDLSCVRSSSHFIHSIMPLNSNEEAPLKHSTPSSMD